MMVSHTFPQRVEGGHPVGRSITDNDDVFNEGGVSHRRLRRLQARGVGDEGLGSI